MIPILIIVIGVPILILLFLLFRKFFLWYWKVNDIIALLEKQNSLLQELINKNRI